MKSIYIGSICNQQAGYIQMTFLNRDKKRGFSPLYNRADITAKNTT